MVSGQRDDLVGVLDRDVIRDLSAGVFFIKTGDPVALVVLFNGRQEFGR